MFQNEDGTYKSDGYALLCMVQIGCDLAGKVLNLKLFKTESDKQLIESLKECREYTKCRLNTLDKMKL